MCAGWAVAMFMLSCYQGRNVHLGCTCKGTRLNLENGGWKEEII